MTAPLDLPSIRALADKAIALSDELHWNLLEHWHDNFEDLLGPVPRGNNALAELAHAAKQLADENERLRDTARELRSGLLDQCSSRTWRHNIMELIDSTAWLALSSSPAAQETDK